MEVKTLAVCELEAIRQCYVGRKINSFNVKPAVAVSKHFSVTKLHVNIKNLD